MSTLFVEMDMPTRCGACKCRHVEFDIDYVAVFCAIKDNKYVEDPDGRPSWCPIGGVLPENHGDLVDYNEVEKEFNRLLTYMEEVPDENGIVWFRRETIMPRGYTMKFHTIIPAERKKDE